MKNAKVVFFDAGGTLFRPYPSVGAVYARTAKKHGVEVEAEVVEKLFYEKWHERNGMTPLASQTSEKIERDWWYGLVKDIFGRTEKGSDPTTTATGGQTPFLTPFKDFDDFFHELYDLFARAECWRLFDDTVPTLEFLKKKGYRLAVISNWDHRLFSIIEQLGLAHFFETVTASSVVGVAKPGRKIFEVALESMKAPGEHCVHIGDSFTDDYHGAQEAGLHGVLLDRPGKGYNGAVQVRTLQELPNLLA